MTEEFAASDDEFQQTDPPVNPEDVEWSPTGGENATWIVVPEAGKVVFDAPQPEPLQVPDAEARELRHDELPVPGVHFVRWQDKDWAVVKRVGATEEQHIRAEVEETKNYVKRMNVRDKHLNAKGVYVPTDPQERLHRAAAYARWRYRGYLAGEVASL